MKEYRVVWSIEIYADSRTEAAMQARLIQLDRSSTACVFEVDEWLVDLSDVAEAGGFKGTA